MGRSAKVHKRVQKNTASSSNSQPKPVAPELKAKAKQSAGASSSVQSAGKRANLKSKVRGKPSKSEGGHILAGADYVTLLMGGGRKAAEEALKLPTEEE